MTIRPYVQGYPPDGYSLGQTKSTIRNNLDGTFLTLAVDHVNNNGPDMQPPGYHTVIHQVPQSSVNTVSGYSQIFAGEAGVLVVNGTTTAAIPPGNGQQLYSLTADGSLSQMTGAIHNSYGLVWAAGILFQWGTATLSASSSQSGTVMFREGFPKNCYNVQLTLNSLAGSVNESPANLYVVYQSVSQTGFTYQYNQNAGAFSNQFFWFAIGD